mgnify:CR=1 FL=1
MLFLYLILDRLVITLKENKLEYQDMCTRIIVNMSTSVKSYKISVNQYNEQHKADNSLSLPIISLLYREGK